MRDPYFSYCGGGKIESIFHVLGTLGDSFFFFFADSAQFCLPVFYMSFSLYF